jgi:hypothetical protein
MRGRYRLTAPALAVFPVNGTHQSATAPIGTILDLDGKPFNGERLMDVLWDGRKVMMFTDELRVKTLPA